MSSNCKPKISNKINDHTPPLSYVPLEVRSQACFQRANGHFSGFSPLREFLEVISKSNTCRDRDIKTHEKPHKRPNRRKKGVEVRKRSTICQFATGLKLTVKSTSFDPVHPSAVRVALADHFGVGQHQYQLVELASRQVPHVPLKHRSRR